MLDVKLLPCKEIRAWRKGKDELCDANAMVKCDIRIENQSSDAKFRYVHPRAGIQIVYFGNSLRSLQSTENMTTNIGISRQAGNGNPRIPAPLRRNLVISSA